MVFTSVWFAARSADAVRDFWDRFDVIVDGHERVSPARSGQIRERLQLARAGDWAPFEEFLAALGREHADQGGSPADWQRHMGSYYTAVLPSIVETTERKRLVGVLLVLRDYIAQSNEIILREFHATRERRAGEKLEEETRAFWSHALEQVGFGIVVSERTSRCIRRVNPAYARLVGYEPDELIGFDGSRLMTGNSDDLASVASLLHERGHHTYELRLVHRSGATVPVLVSSSTLDTASGPLLISTVIDVSERERLASDNESLVASLETRVRERTAELQSANRELEAFSYTISHDLRTPLRAIDGFGRALIADYGAVLDDTGVHYIERIRAGTLRMGRLIDDLLALARIGRATIEIRDLDISALVAEIIAELRMREPQRDVAVTIQPGMTARADLGLARIVLDNLLGNAWKFCVHATTPSIAIGYRDGLFHIRDNGAGFDMAYSSKLFQPFQRLHAATEFEGSGIGLATVHRIISHHRGSIRIEGELGKGATVSFSFGPRS